MTESVLTLVYAMAIGLSTAATALVARRIGEDNARGAGQTVGQVILVSLVLALALGIPGVLLAETVLRMMGGDERLIASGADFTRLIFASAPAIILLHTLSGCLRGAGNASIAMRSLWVANGINIVLCPVFIFGLGPFPELGVVGSAVATTIGRSTGVLYQFYALTRQRNLVQIHRSDFTPNSDIIRRLLNVAAGGTGQFLIGSASWVFLTRIVSTFGSDVVAGYTIAIRIVMFTLMPAWGLANAAATLVGQNLGAGQPDRAETSAWRAALCNVIFLSLIGVLFYNQAAHLVGLFDNDSRVLQVAVACLRVLCIGYVSFALGMVLSQALNGAGDTRTPTVINLICFWAVEIPLAYWLAKSGDWGPAGVYWAVAISESLLALFSIWVFRQGRWKTLGV